MKHERQVKVDLGIPTCKTCGSGGNASSSLRWGDAPPLGGAGAAGAHRDQNKSRVDTAAAPPPRRSHRPTVLPIAADARNTSTHGPRRLCRHRTGMAPPLARPHALLTRARLCSHGTPPGGARPPKAHLRRAAGAAAADPGKLARRCRPRGHAAARAAARRPKRPLRCSSVRAALQQSQSVLCLAVPGVFANVHRVGKTAIVGNANLLQQGAHDDEVTPLESVRKTPKETFEETLLPPSTIDQSPGL